MIKIYGKPNCGQCVEAKNICESRGLDYQYLSLGQDYSREELLDMFPGARQVPQIVVGETKVGDITAFKKHIIQ